MQVGTIVKLKVACLGNPKGAKGVVYYNYGNGFQTIFENGNLDGFSTERLMPDGQIEADYFLEKIGLEPSLIDYEFHNIIQTGQDFHRGLFDIVLKKKGET